MGICALYFPLQISAVFPCLIIVLYTFASVRTNHLSLKFYDQVCTECLENGFERSKKIITKNRRRSWNWHSMCEDVIPREWLYIHKVTPLFCFLLILVGFGEVRIKRSCTFDGPGTARPFVVTSVWDSDRIWSGRRCGEWTWRWFSCGVVVGCEVDGGRRRARGRQRCPRPYATRSSHSLSTGRGITVHHNTGHFRRFR